VEAEGSAVSPTATTNTKKRVKKIQTVISSSSNTFTQSKKKDAKDKMHQQQQKQQLLEERCDPKRRGIHPDDALMVGMAPTSASTCVDCHTKIVQGSIRFGIKYAGNPLPNIPVIPLYGTHPVPMYMWCHAGTGDTTTTGTSSQNRRLPCGLSYCRLSKTMSDAERTCHACQDLPSPVGSIRLLCGGPPKGKKICRHAFHIQCWIQTISRASISETAKQQLLSIPIESIGTTNKRRRITDDDMPLSWNDLLAHEQEQVRHDFLLPNA
jgi:hypothetical protein